MSKDWECWNVCGCWGFCAWGYWNFFLWWLLCTQCLSVWDVLLRMVWILHITIPVLFYVFTNGAVWSPSTLLYLLQSHSGTGNCCFMGLWLNFYCRGGSRCRGELASLFLTQTNFLMLTLFCAMECLFWLEYLQVADDYYQLRSLCGVGFFGVFPFLNFPLLWVWSQAFVWLCCLPWGGYGFGYYSHFISFGWDQFPSFVTGFCPSSD